MATVVIFYTDPLKLSDPIVEMLKQENHFTILLDPRFNWKDLDADYRSWDYATYRKNVCIDATEVREETGKWHHYLMNCDAFIQVGRITPESAFCLGIIRTRTNLPLVYEINTGVTPDEDLFDHSMVDAELDFHTRPDMIASINMLGTSMEHPKMLRFPTAQPKPVATTEEEDRKADERRKEDERIQATVDLQTRERLMGLERQEAEVQKITLYMRVNYADEIADKEPQHQGSISDAVIFYLGKERRTGLWGFLRRVQRIFKSNS